MTIEDILKAWTNSETFPTRTFSVLDKTFVEGEKAYKLEIATRVKFPHKSIDTTISNKTFFQCLCQNHTDCNANGDFVQLEKIIETLESEFNKQYSQFVDQNL